MWGSERAAGGKGVGGKEKRREERQGKGCGRGKEGGLLGEGSISME